MLRVYFSTDLVGVEIGGAVKNVMAIAAGISDGLGLGLNARAALVTRGLAEMARLGAAMGGAAETFFGLAGAGDLILTATGDLSRNRRVGLELAQGRALREILANLGHVAEGVRSAKEVSRLAAARASRCRSPTRSRRVWKSGSRRRRPSSCCRRATRRWSARRRRESRAGARLRTPRPPRHSTDSSCDCLRASAA